MKVFCDKYQSYISFDKTSYRMFCILLDNINNLNNSRTIEKKLLHPLYSVNDSYFFENNGINSKLYNTNFIIYSIFQIVETDPIHFHELHTHKNEFCALLSTYLIANPEVLQYQENYNLYDLHTEYGKKLFHTAQFLQEFMYIYMTGKSQEYQIDFRRHYNDIFLYNLFLADEKKMIPRKERWECETFVKLIETELKKYPSKYESIIHYKNRALLFIHDLLYSNNSNNNNGINRINMLFQGCLYIINIFMLSVILLFVVGLELIFKKNKFINKFCDKTINYFRDYECKLTKKFKENTEGKE